MSGHLRGRNVVPRAFAEWKPPFVAAKSIGVNCLPVTPLDGIPCDRNDAQVIDSAQYGGRGDDVVSFVTLAGLLTCLTCLTMLALNCPEQRSFSSDF